MAQVGNNNLLYPDLSFANPQSLYVGDNNQEYKALMDKQETNFYNNRKLADLAKETLSNLQVSQADSQYKKEVEDKVEQALSTIEETGRWEQANDLVRSAANEIAMNKPFNYAVKDYKRKEAEKANLLARTDITSEQKMKALNEANSNDKGIQPIYGDNNKILTYKSTYDLHNPAKYVDGAKYTAEFASKAKADKFMGNFVYDEKNGVWRNKSDLNYRADGSIQTTPDGKYIFNTTITRMSEDELYSALGSNLNQNPEWQDYVESELRYIKAPKNLSPEGQKTLKSEYLKTLKNLGVDTDDYKNFDLDSLKKEIYRRKMVHDAVVGNAKLFGYTEIEDKFLGTSFDADMEMMIAKKNASGTATAVGDGNFTASYLEAINNPQGLPVDISNLQAIQADYDANIKRDQETLTQIKSQLIEAEKSNNPESIQSINNLKKREAELITNIATYKNNKEDYQKLHDKAVAETVAEMNAKKAGSGDALANQYNKVFNPAENKSNETINEIVDKVYDFYSKKNYTWSGIGEDNLSSFRDIYGIPLTSFKNEDLRENIKSTLRDKLIKGDPNRIIDFGNRSGVPAIANINPKEVGLSEKLIEDYNNYEKSINNVTTDLSDFKSSINKKMKDFAESRTFSPGMVDLSAGNGDKYGDYSKESKFSNSLTNSYRNNNKGWVWINNKTGKQDFYDTKTGVSENPIGAAVDIVGMTSAPVPGHGYLLTAKVYDMEEKDGKKVRIEGSEKTRLLKPTSGELSNAYNLAINEAEVKGLLEYADRLKQQKADMAMSYFDNFAVSPGTISTKYAIYNPESKASNNIIVERIVDNSYGITYRLSEDPTNTKKFGVSPVEYREGNPRISVEKALEQMELTVNGATMRTDRHHNPLATAVLRGKGNNFTRALNDAGISWSYGSTFKAKEPDGTEQEYATIKINNPNDAYRASIVQLKAGAISSWFATDKYAKNFKNLPAAKRLGITSEADFNKLTEAEQINFIKQIAADEGSMLYK